MNSIEKLRYLLITSPVFLALLFFSLSRKVEASVVQPVPIDAAADCQVLGYLAGLKISTSDGTGSVSDGNLTVMIDQNDAGGFGWQELSFDKTTIHGLLVHAQSNAESAWYEYGGQALGDSIFFDTEIFETVPEVQIEREFEFCYELDEQEPEATATDVTPIPTAPTLLPTQEGLTPQATVTQVIPTATLGATFTPEATLTQVVPTATPEATVTQPAPTSTDSPIPQTPTIEVSPSPVPTGPTNSEETAEPTPPQSTPKPEVTTTPEFRLLLPTIFG